VFISDLITTPIHLQRQLEIRAAIRCRLDCLCPCRSADSISRKRGKFQFALCAATRSKMTGAQPITVFLLANVSRRARSADAHAAA
jgi:hypothetical protein